MRRVLLLPLFVLTLYAAPARPPILYTISFPETSSKSFTVQMIVPTDGRPAVDLMMPAWSPGFYDLQNYAARVTAFTARGADGAALERPTPSVVGLVLDAHIRHHTNDRKSMDDVMRLEYRRARSDDPARAWTLEVRPDATPAQKAHLASLLAHSKN